MTWRVLAGLLFAGVAAFLLWLTVDPATSSHGVRRITQALLFESIDAVPPEAGSGGVPTALPFSRQVPEGRGPQAIWVDMQIELPDAPQGFQAVLLPYLYGGGHVWLNGALLGEIPVTTDHAIVRWERPHLLAVAPGRLHAGLNALQVNAGPVDGRTVLYFPAVELGPIAVMQARHDKRFFWVHTMPELTVVGCLIAAALVLMIWWRLPEEVLYGWFGVATLLWGLRTLTFVMESVPPERWSWWRLVYLASTGGFIVMMALFAARLAGLRNRWAERGLLVYWLIGPVWFLLAGLGSDAQINRMWTAGLIPIGIGTVVVSFVAVWRQRTPASLLLPLALAVATMSGMHDYIMVWKPELLARIAPDWADQRLFLLHHGANNLLVTMGVLLSTRFVRSVRQLRELNETLETRIADRERSLAENFDRVSELELRNAAAEERRLIMREIHDGLGSKLFTSLSRVERGAMDKPEMATALRACISEMRLALDALAPDDHDLLTAFGDFMFRWQAELQAAGMHCDWTMDVDADDLPLPPHATLQVLRVAQEALTNVAKHSRAGRVQLSLSEREGQLALRIRDDGVGVSPGTGSSGRGLGNMRVRAEQLGGTLAVSADPIAGTVVTLTVPIVAMVSAPKRPAGGQSTV